MKTLRLLLIGENYSKEPDMGIWKEEGAMDFYKRMEKVCHMIPYGKAATYGQIALLCGRPRNARQVGYALSHKNLDGQIPAWRIVNSSGFLSGAASFEYPETQRLLLMGEGVEVSPENRVDLKRYGWKSTFEDAMELCGIFEREGI